jgi:RNA polymerase sigma-70 factor (ECF subfamily)
MKIDRSDEQKGTGGAAAPARASAMSTELLFRAYADFVAAFLSRLGVPQADVDDAVQEVFLVTHRKGGYVPGAAQPRTWLAAIAVLIAQANARKRARRRARSHWDELDDARLDSVDPHLTLAAREALRRVQRALDTLELSHRAVFVLFEIEGEPCEAIAASFGIPLGTVHSRLHHARRRFMKAYQQQSDDGAQPRAKTAEGT